MSSDKDNVLERLAIPHDAATEEEDQGFVIKSSGKEHRQFDTGAVRDSASGKPRPDLIHPHFERRVGQHLGDAARPKKEGGKGYGAWNWSKGIPLSESFASLRRHMMEYAEGDRAEDHLAAAACNIMFIMCTEHMVKEGILPESLLDMQDWTKEKTHD